MPQESSMERTEKTILIVEDEKIIAIMDIDLGEGKMDGTDVAKAILKDYDLPIVFCTSHSEKEYVDKVKGITRYGYVIKNSGEFVLKQSIDMAFELFDTHRELKESNEEWRNTFNAIKDIVTIISKDHKITKINNAGCKSLGLPQEKIINKKCYEIVHNTDSPISVCPCTASLETGKPSFSEYTENGRVYDLTAWPIYGADNQVHSFVHIVKDITEQKRMEQALRISEERYRKAQAVARVGSWEYHIGNDTFCGSEEGKRIYGFDPETDAFTAEEVMQCVVEKERVNQALIDLIERNKPYDIEFDIRPRNSEETRRIRSVAELERDENGNPHIVTGVLHDITERK